MNRFQVGEMHAAPGGYCGVAPLCGDRLNVSTVVRTDVLRESKLTATQFFERWIEEHPALRDSLEGAERVSPVRGVSPIGSRVRQSWHPGALLVGDAAGFFDPFTGEGIYRAIRGAALVSAVGAAALHKRDTTSRTLAVYENQRRSSFLAKQAVTALVQVFVQYPFLMEYSLPRLGGRSRTHGILCSALGDVGDAAAFLRPAVLLDALRP